MKDKNIYHKEDKIEKNLKEKDLILLQSDRK